MPAENSEEIEIPFAFRTRVGPGKSTYSGPLLGEYCSVFIQHKTAF